MSLSSDEFLTVLMKARREYEILLEEFGTLAELARSAIRGKHDGSLEDYDLEEFLKDQGLWNG